MMRHNRSNGEEETDHFKTRKNHRIKTEPDKRCEDAVLRYQTMYIPHLQYLVQLHFILSNEDLTTTVLGNKKARLCGGKTSHWSEEVYRRSGNTHQNYW